VCVPRSRLSFLALALAGLTACGDDPPPAAPSVTPPALHHVEMDGPAIRTLGYAASLQLRAFAVFADGSRAEVTAEAAWSTNEPGVLSVSASGLVTAIGAGSAVVTAAYRERSAVATLAVGGGPANTEVFAMTGVVRDGVRGTPIEAADVLATGAAIESRGAVTDRNGTFDLGPGRGPVSVRARRFGYLDAIPVLVDVTAPVSFDVRLAPLPGGDYIERSVEGVLSNPDPLGGAATLQVNTRLGGYFDAEAEAAPCNGRLQLVAESDFTRYASTGDGCRARVTFLVTASRIALTVNGRHGMTYRLRFLELR
jgi:hypothetical protein